MFTQIHQAALSQTGSIFCLKFSGIPCSFPPDMLHIEGDFDMTVADNCHAASRLVLTCKKHRSKMHCFSLLLCQTHTDFAFNCVFFPPQPPKRVKSQLVTQTFSLAEPLYAYLETHFAGFLLLEVLFLCEWVKVRITPII